MIQQSHAQMAEASNTDAGKSWELIDVFDDLQLRNEAHVDQGNSMQCEGNDMTPKLPGMTAEYREFCCDTFHSGIVPIEDLHKLVYDPLKNKYPDKFLGKNQDVEFFSAYTVDGKRFYKKLSGKERDIAVQKDIFEQVKRRKVIEIFIQSLRFKIQTKQQDLSLFKPTCDPAKAFIFESLLKNVELAIDRGITCEATLKQLDRLIALSWILFFGEDVAKKRKKSECSNLKDSCLNKYNHTTRVASDQPSKRMKGNTKEKESILSTVDADSDEAENLDWKISSSNGYSTSSDE